MSEDVQAYFVGPDDSETCDGCDGAVAGNPYTPEDVPEPGEFECGNNCRHMVQLDGEATDEEAPYTWTANLGFGEATGWTDEDIANLSSDELTSAVDEGTLTTDEAAILADEAGLPAVALTEAEFDEFLAAADVDVMSETIATDAKMEEYAQSLAAQGFDEAEAEQAYYLADALNDALGGDYGVVLRDNMFYVESGGGLTESQGRFDSHATIRLTEIGTASSGDRGHAGRKGQVGGSEPGSGDAPKKPGRRTAAMPAGWNAHDLEQSTMVANIKKIYAEVSPTTRADGYIWYESAHDLATRLATQYGTTVEKASGVISALSPLSKWSENQKNAENFIRDRTQGIQTQANYDKAAAILDGSGTRADILKVLGGPKYARNAQTWNKTMNFYSNIIDPADPRYVTMDRHAISIAVGKPLGSDAGAKMLDYLKYEKIAEAYRVAAKDLNIPITNDLQAVTWLHWTYNYAPQKTRDPHLKEAWVKGLPDWLQPAEGEPGFGYSKEDLDRPASYFESVPLRETIRIVEVGTASSGNYGHVGRPGQVGGSGAGVGLSIHNEWGHMIPGDADHPPHPTATLIIGGTGVGKGKIVDRLMANGGIPQSSVLNSDHVKNTMDHAKGLGLYTEAPTEDGKYGASGPRTRTELHQRYSPEEIASVDKWVQQNTKYANIDDFAKNNFSSMEKYGGGLTHELSSYKNYDTLRQHLTPGHELSGRSFILDSTGNADKYLHYINQARAMGMNILIQQAYAPRAVGFFRNFELRPRSVALEHAIEAHDKADLAGRVLSKYIEGERHSGKTDIRFRKENTFNDAQLKQAHDAGYTDTSIPERNAAGRLNPK